MITLYDFVLSGSCYKVRLLLNILKLPHKIIDIDFIRKEHKTEDFLKVNAFGDESLRDGEEIVAYVAVAVMNAGSFAAASDLAHQMQEAMRSRTVIDMAKGILMAQNRCGPDEAFTMLSRASQRSNRKLRDLAASIVGTVSGMPPDSPDS